MQRERRTRAGNKLGNDFAGNLERLAEGWDARDEVPKQARRQHDENQTSHNRKIYLKVEPLHPNVLSVYAECEHGSSVLGFGEHVTCAADRDDAPRFFWIIFDRGADPGDMHINRAVESLDRLALDRVH